MAHRWFQGGVSQTGARLRLFCFPYAGGSALAYREWQRAVTDVIEVLPLELPGHGSRMGEPLFTELTSCAKAAACELSDVFRAGPFALWGHSMGALIAFELERTLEYEYGIRAEILFVAGARAPHLRPKTGNRASLSDVDLIKMLSSIGATPAELLDNPGAMSCLLPIIRADCEMVEGYAADSSVKVQCPVFAMGAVDDPEVPVAHIKAWEMHTAGGFSNSLFSGGHFFVNSARSAVIRKILMSIGSSLPRGSSVRVTNYTIKESPQRL